MLVNIFASGGADRSKMERLVQFEAEVGRIEVELKRLGLEIGANVANARENGLGPDPAVANYRGGANDHE